MKRAVLALILAAAVQGTAPAQAPFPLEEVTAAQLQAWMTSGRYTAVLIKDNIDTADRMMTTAGSLALEGARPARDAVLSSGPPAWRAPRSSAAGRCCARRSEGRLGSNPSRS